MGCRLIIETIFFKRIIRLATFCLCRVPDTIVFDNFVPTKFQLTAIVNAKRVKGKILKYGAKTGKVVELKLSQVAFFGYITLGYDAASRIQIFGDLHIGLAESSMSTGGDSGGPWFCESTRELIGIHRGYVTFYQNNEQIFPDNSEMRFYACTSFFQKDASLLAGWHLSNEKKLH